MVGNVTSLTNNGLRDWLIQRATALVIGVYALVLLGFFMRNSTLDFTHWQEFFSSKPMQILGTLAVMSIVLHAWIGIWTVCTDYIKPACIRMGVTFLVLLLDAILLVWGIKVVWGI